MGGVIFILRVIFGIFVQTCELSLTNNNNFEDNIYAVKLTVTHKFSLFFSIHNYIIVFLLYSTSKKNKVLSK